MSDITTWWAAAAGAAPPREVLAAQEGLTRAQRRAARRAVRRGEAVDDLAVARLAVALARLHLRRNSPTATGFFALMVAGAAALAVMSFVLTNTILAGVILALFTTYGLWVLARLRPAAQDAVRAAEQTNRVMLQRAGRPYREDPHAAEPYQPHPAAVATGVVALWIFYDLVFGGAGALTGRSMELGEVVARGALFATFMTIANLTFVRRRTKRQSQHPIA